MNIKNPSRKQFTAMFCQTMKLTSIMAVLALLCFLFFTFIEYEMYDSEYIRATAHFFNDLRESGGVKDFANLAFIGAGVFNSLICFNFAWSKKQSNVVLSLGMRKSDIYFAKILGGIVPMAITFLLAGVAETISNTAGNYTIDKRYFAMAALTMLQYLAIYILSFTLSSAVMSNTGNVVEGTIFTCILALFPIVVKGFLSHIFWGLTLGAYLEPKSMMSDIKFNWANPFRAFYNIETSFMSGYFYKDETSLPSVSDWSGVIMAGVYAVVILGLGYLGFKKRRNEICGTWGRAKGMNEIAGAVTAFYAAYIFGVIWAGQDHGNANFLTFFITCLAFLLTYVIFKLIFGYKRKKEIKAAFSRFPAYAIGFAVVFMVFHFGLFGYSSKVPESQEIASVKVVSPYYKYLDDMLSGSSEFALKSQFRPYQGYRASPDFDGSMFNSYQNFSQVTFTNYQDIEKAVKVHESFISDGKLKNNGAHSWAADVIITYTLKNGKEITRYYSEATEGTTLKLMALNDSTEFNNLLFNQLKNRIGFDIFGDGELDIENYEEYYDTENDNSIELFGYKYEDGDLDYIFGTKFAYLATEQCYLFPTDMQGGYKLGYIDEELYYAIITDIKKVSANEYFNHSQEDELGILSFGLSSSIYTDTFEILDPETNEIVISSKTQEEKEKEENIIPNGTVRSTSWNINSYDIKAIVITKSMTNTIEYLKEHDLLKHFERRLNVEDIKSVKVATAAELYSKTFDKTQLYPIFYGAYWTGEQMHEYTKELSQNIHHNYYFNNIDNQITDRKQIKELVDNAVVFSYCPNDAKIVEITYKDGSVATVMVRADASQ